MTSITFKQIIYRLSIMGVVMGILITTYDVLVGSLLEAVHILFEVIEVVLDNVVEELFHTGVHETQTIVFYLLIAIGIGISYYLSRALAKLYHTLIDTCSIYKTTIQLYWHDMPLLHKITWVGCLIAVFILSLMFFGLM